MLRKLLNNKNPFIRKGVALILKNSKKVLANYASGQNPILCNSFPKSGTHLLKQILSGIPGLRYYGEFIVTTPSIKFMEISRETIIKKLNNIVDGELVLAHLFYSDAVASYINQKGIKHFFIYRDPRDVVISEVYYLTFTNKWHFLHKYFRKMKNHDERITASIMGINSISRGRCYENINERFMKYHGWLKDSNVFNLKYEDLINENLYQEINRILVFYYNTNIDDIENKLTKTMLNKIQPRKSHTYRKGKKSNWKHEFTEYHKKIFKDIAGDLLIKLGYEKDFSW